MHEIGDVTSPLLDPLAHLRSILVMIIASTRPAHRLMVEQQIANMRKNAQLGEFGLGCMSQGVREEIGDLAFALDLGVQNAALPA